MSAAILCSLLMSPVQDANPAVDFPKTPLPMFAFAKAGQGGKLVTISVKGGGEIRVQSYKTQVPYTKMAKPEPDKPARPEIAYMRVTRKRLVYHGMKMTSAGGVKEGPVFDYPTQKRVPYKIQDCKFFDLSGKPVEAAEVAKRLSKRSPILIVVNEKEIDPFYRSALNQQMLQFVPKPAEKNQTMKGPQPK